MTRLFKRARGEWYKSHIAEPPGQADAFEWGQSQSNPQGSDANEA